MKHIVKGVLLGWMVFLPLKGFAGSIDWGISPTASIALGDNKAKPAYGVDGRLYYLFNDYFAAGTNVGYTYQATDKITLISVTPGVQVGTTLNLVVVSIRPYVSGGVGYYRTKYGDTSASPIAGGGTVNNTGVHAGGGLNVALPGVVVGADVRYERIFDSGKDREFVRPSLNIGFPF